MLERLETWLAVHAPVTHAGLCPPAGADLLQALGDPETAMLYAWHNGSRGSFQLAPSSSSRRSSWAASGLGPRMAPYRH